MKAENPTVNTAADTQEENGKEPENLKECQILKIVITGGPAAGKTSAIESLKKHLKDFPYPVLYLQETATELIRSGFTPWVCDSTFHFQHLLFQLQISRENIFEKAAHTLGSNRVVIVLDRGAMDGNAYLSDELYARILKEEGFSRKKLLNRYDRIIHLESSAAHSLEDYSLENNEARFETATEAAEVEKETLRVWQDHPRRTLVPAAGHLEEKISDFLNVFDEILKEEGFCG